jgi:hypothetical protein
VAIASCDATNDVVSKLVAKMKALTEPIARKEETKIAPVNKSLGTYADLAMDSDGDEELSANVTPRVTQKKKVKELDWAMMSDDEPGLSKNVTVRVVKKKTRNWADWSDDEEDM